MANTRIGNFGAIHTEETKLSQAEQLFDIVDFTHLYVVGEVLEADAFRLKEDGIRITPFIIGMKLEVTVYPNS